MKVLHSKATTEPILLVSACHNMNLFAVVTRSAVTVYRSTTLTVVTTLPLRSGHAAPLTQNMPELSSSESHSKLCGAWSPTGRLFTLALPNGCVLVLDVEDGNLVRRFVPSSLMPSVLSCTAGEEEGTTATSGAAASSGGRGIADDYEEGGLHSCSARALQVPLILPLSTGACPVAALAWEAVRSSHSPSSSPASRNSGPVAQCLPLRLGLSAPLLEEAMQGPTAATAAAAPPSHDTGSAAVAVLLVLDERGAMSYVVGGLQEVAHHTVQLPISLSGNGNNDDDDVAHVSQFSISTTVKTHSVLPGQQLQSVQDVAALAGLPPALLTFNLPSSSSGNSAAVTGRASSSSPSVYVEGTAYMAIANNNRSAQAKCHQLLAMPLEDRLARAVDPSITTLCSVAEYCRAAATCLRAVRRRWHQVVHDQLHRDLSLRENAKLLRDAVMEHIACPDEEALCAYYSNLDQASVMADLEKMMETLSSIAQDVCHVCYRSYDLALSLIDADNSSSSSSATSQRTEGGPVHVLRAAVGELRRQCECFLHRLHLEGQYERELAQFILQRASLCIDPSTRVGANTSKADNPTGRRSGGEEAAAAAAAQQLREVHPPLHVARHPTLLRSIERIAKGISSVGDYNDVEQVLFVDGGGGDVAITPEKVQSIIEAGIRECIGHQFSDGQGYLVKHAGDDDVLLDLMLAPSAASSDEANAAPSSHPAAAFQDENEEAVQLGVHPIARIVTSPMSTRSSRGNATLAVSNIMPTTRWCDGLQLGTLTTDTHPITMCEEVANKLPQNSSLQWHCLLREDRHLCLFTGSDADRFTMLMVDDNGDVLQRDVDDEEEKDDNEDGDADGDGSNQPQHVVAVITGMPTNAGPLMVTVSRAREFCVVAVKDRMIVVDLYDD